MRIRTKIILVVLPLLIVTLLLSAIASSLSARNGITQIAVDFLGFKAQELGKYADSQWNLLEANGLSGRPEYVEAARRAVGSYALALLRRESEMILAFDSSGELALRAGGIELTPQEHRSLSALLREKGDGWLEFRSGGVQRVGQAFGFEPFEWDLLVSEERASFFRAVTEITTQSAVIVAAACLFSLALLLMFSGYLTRPITRMAGAMKGIIGDNDLSRRVTVEYRDEIGELAHTFNIMTGKLEEATHQIKSYALRAVIARKQEKEIRNIFQRYVPKDVIDRFFKNPESMLVGENRELAVLFSDIRGFTTIAELMPPDQMVESLNAYFSRMVNIITARRGIVDKYIGDAIMAFYGAPVQHADDALQAVVSAMEMLAGLQEFNRVQETRGKPEFRIGIGINYGQVTVGNIGHPEKKMDYTVIGDGVNLASRLENLTKFYQQELIVSESVYQKVKGILPTRQLDKVVVKGKTQGERIFTVRKVLTEPQRKAWTQHREALKLYYRREFQMANQQFRMVQNLMPGDPVSALFIRRCAEHLKNPPPEEWQGVEVLKNK